MKKTVETLVSFGTRHSLSSQTDPKRGVGAARDWIYGEFERISRDCGGCLTVEKQTFLQAKANRIPQPVEITNVVATLRGTTDPDRVYVVSGHYASMCNLDATDATCDAPGANDDASGVAVVLELARVMSKRKFDATIIFMAVAGEEQVVTDGGRRTFLVLRTPLPGPDGRPRGLCVVATDVTELRRQREALQLTEERYRLVLRATRDAVWDWGIVHVGEHTVQYGRFASTASQLAKQPVLFALFDANGPRPFALTHSYEIDWAEGTPRRIRMHSRVGKDRVELVIDVTRQVEAETGGGKQGLFQADPNARSFFIQMEGKARLTGALDRKKIDILHLHGYGATTFGRMAAALRGIPAILHEHANLTDTPWFQKIADRFLERYTDIAIAVSKSTAEFVINARLVQPEKVKVVYLGAPHDEFSRPRTPDEISTARRELGIGPAEFCAGTITRLHDSKGNSYLVDAAAQVVQQRPHARFVLVGEGPLRPDLEAQAARLGLGDRFRFAGFHRDAARALSAFDVSVFPSLWEGTPLTAFEALAMGKPIVATDADGLVDILSDGKDAVIVPKRNAKALADAIVRTIDHPEERSRLASAAAVTGRRYARRMSVERICRAHASSCVDAAGRQPAREETRVFKRRVGDTLANSVDHEPVHAVEAIDAFGLPRQRCRMRLPGVVVNELLERRALGGPPRGVVSGARLLTEYEVDAHFFQPRHVRLDLGDGIELIVLAVHHVEWRSDEVVAVHLAVGAGSERLVGTRRLAHPASGRRHARLAPDRRDHLVLHGRYREQRAAAHRTLPAENGLEVLRPGTRPGRDPGHGPGEEDIGPLAARRETHHLTGGGIETDISSDADDVVPRFLRRLLARPSGSASSHSPRPICRARSSRYRVSLSCRRAIRPESQTPCRLHG